MQESALVDWALALLAADHGGIGAAIRDGMGRATSALGAQRCLAFRYVEAAGEAEAIYEWSDGSAPSLLGALYRDAELPAAMAAMRRGHTVTMTVNDDEPGCPGLRALITEQRTQGCILLPVRSAEQLRWVFGFEWRIAPPNLTDELVAFARRAVAVFAAGARRADELADSAETQAQMLARQKLETLGIMAGGIVHDFNNMLQVILGLSEVLTRHVQPGPGLELLGDIQQTVARAAELTQRFLVFSRQDVRKRRNIRVVDALEDMLKLLASSVPENRQLRADLRGQDLVVYMPRAEFEQAIVNLCNNAVAATPTGGTLTIACDRVGADQPMAEITVTDDGEGMSPETLAHACEPFFTTKPPSEGTGLGLAMVKRTVESSGGTLELTSKLGEGTRVRMLLPLSTMPDAEEDTYDDGVYTGTECVLVVEDEAMVRRVTASQLERAGYTVLRAADGEQALELFRQHSDRLALILTDVIMPKLGGVELFHAIAHDHRPPAFLFATGYDAGGLSEEFLNAPGRGLLQKPYSGRQMLAKVRGLIDARRGEDSC